MQIFEEAANHFASPSSPSASSAAAAAEAASHHGIIDARLRAQTGHEPELASLSDLPLSSPVALRRAASACDMHGTMSGASSALPFTSSPPSEAGSSCGTPTLRQQRMAPSPQSRDSPMTNPESSLDAHSSGTPQKMSANTVRPAALSHVSATARLRCGSAPAEDAVWDHVEAGETAQALRFD